MRKYAFVITTALGLALAAGSVLAGAKIGGGSDRSGNGVQLNGIPPSGFAVETEERAQPETHRAPQRDQDDRDVGQVAGRPHRQEGGGRGRNREELQQDGCAMLFHPSRAPEQRSCRVTRARFSVKSRRARGGCACR